MRKAIVTALAVLIVWIDAQGQTLVERPILSDQEIVVKKQIMVDGLERDLKQVPFAAVRVFVRTKIATWLLKEGTDETGRAELVAIKAVEDLYDNQREIPVVDFNTLKSDVFGLLETRSKETAKRLREKYRTQSNDELADGESLLNQANGDKKVAAKLLRSLNDRSGLGHEFAVLLERMQSVRSPEVPSILARILSLEEIQSSGLPTTFLYSIVHVFNDASVSPEIQHRFYSSVLRRARIGATTFNVDIDVTYDLLNAVVPNLRSTSSELLAESMVLQQALRSRLSQAAQSEIERETRIRESADELSALVSEAEAASDSGVKYLLYVRAAKLALKRQRFIVAVDLAAKSVSDGPDQIPKAFREQWSDQFLREVVLNALKKEELESAQYAIKRMNGLLSMSDSKIAIARYFNRLNNKASAIDSLENALSLVQKVETSDAKIFALFRLLSSVILIDASRMAEVAALTAKLIEAVPALEVEDKPTTSRYQEYVRTAMVINYNLFPAIIELSQKNDSDAADFASRISRKEIRVVADLAILINEIEIDQERTASSDRGTK